MGAIQTLTEINGAAENAVAKWEKDEPENSCPHIDKTQSCIKQAYDDIDSAIKELEKMPDTRWAINQLEAAKGKLDMCDSKLETIRDINSTLRENGKTLCQSINDEVINAL